MTTIRKNHATIVTLAFFFVLVMADSATSSIPIATETLLASETLTTISSGMSLVSTWTIVTASGADETVTDVETVEGQTVTSVYEEGVVAFSSVPTASESWVTATATEVVVQTMGFSTIFSSLSVSTKSTSSSTEAAAHASIVVSPAQHTPAANSTSTPELSSAAVAGIGVAVGLSIAILTVLGIWVRTQQRSKRERWQQEPEELCATSQYKDLAEICGADAAPRPTYEMPTPGPELFGTIRCEADGGYCSQQKVSGETQ